MQVRRRVRRTLVNLLVYHGVLAPNAKWRTRVVDYGRQRPRTPAATQPTKSPAVGTATPSNSEWARLMRRAFDLDALCCPRCGGRMRTLALIESPCAVRRILRHLGLQAHPPPMTRARTTDLDFHAA